MKSRKGGIWCSRNADCGHIRTSLGSLRVDTSGQSHISKVCYVLRWQVLRVARAQITCSRIMCLLVAGCICLLRST
uniref:Uncharacterized protein n=1 Tax=Triticum urartu TaxID=4572 RepID=A0A8R7R5X8_TRIUA